MVFAHHNRPLDEKLGAIIGRLLEQPGPLEHRTPFFRNGHHVLRPG